MPRRKGKKLTAHKPSPKKSPSDASKKINKDYMKNWVETVSKLSSAKNGSGYDFDNEIFEINSDEESDEFECNLKELEVNMINKVCFVINFYLLSFSETSQVSLVSWLIRFSVIGNP